MELVVGVRSGVVELVYLILFELIALSILLRTIEVITRQIAKRKANKNGHVTLIGNRWTEVLGRGSTQSGLILKAVFWAVALTSILMIDFGTNGFTELGVISEEVVYLGKTSDVDSQLAFLRSLYKARENNSTIGYYEIWWDFLEACQERRPQNTTAFRSFCGTSLCRTAFREGEQLFTNNDDLEITQENQMPDHSDNFRCNDGKDAPEVILSTYPRIAPKIGVPSSVILDYEDDSWTQIFVELDLTNTVFSLHETFGADDPLNGWHLNCAYIEFAFQLRRRNCIFSYIAEEGDVILMGSTSSPQGQEDLWSDQLNNKIDVNSYNFAEFPQTDEELRSSNHTQWMLALNVLAIFNDVPALDYVRHINSVLELGPNGAEIEESAKTEISTLAFVGVIVLGSAVVLAAFGLLVVIILGKRSSYLNLNLGLDDCEVFCLMRDHADDLCDCRKQRVNYVDIGVSADQTSWGILSDSELPLDGKNIGLKELRQRQVATKAAEDPV